MQEGYTPSEHMKTVRQHGKDAMKRGPPGVKPSVLDHAPTLTKKRSPSQKAAISETFVLHGGHIPPLWMTIYRCCMRQLVPISSPVS